jgi:hypothetical protein
LQPSPSWIALTAPLFVLSVWLLYRTIRSLVGTVRKSIVASVPLREEAALTVDEPGAYDLSVEGSQLSTDFGGLDFAMLRVDGTPVPMRTAWFRTTVSSVSRVRLQLRRLSVEAPGRFTLRISGIKPDQDPENRVVLSRPIGTAIVGHVLALVALGMLTVGSLVASALLLVGPQSSAEP